MNFSLLFLPFFFNFCQNSGFFELKVFQNFFPKNLRICLKEFILKSRDLGDCTFGQKSVLALNSDSIIRIPFEFRWTSSFSLLLEFDSKEKIIIQELDIFPNKTWIKRKELEFRVLCSNNYHGNDCANFCRARDDTFGHYSCDLNGNKVCLEGWKADNCQKPECRVNCNEIHGYCEKPFECQCRNGWKGKHCDQCIEYPGCLHGYCLSPFQCICHRNWGGILCDQDLNYCGTHSPCLNQGQCQNIAPNTYRCNCKEGFEGINCQTIVDSCATQPCLHGGTCQTRANKTDFTCKCNNGFSGERCENDVNECLSNPCLNGGTCYDLNNHYKCQCSNGWTGINCQNDIDECLLHNPCIHSNQCINTLGGFQCICLKGFEGNQCETEVNDCLKNDVICGNGGQCLDLFNDFRCVCLNHFSGQFCHQLDPNVCLEDNSDLFWRFQDSQQKCSKLCLCRDSALLCSQCELNYTTNDCPLADNSQMKLTFADHVPNGICNTIFTIHSLISDSRDFCCSHVTNNTVLVNSVPKIRQFLSSFKELQQIVSINDVKTDFEIYFIFLIIFVLIFVFLIFFVYFFKKTLTQRSRASEVIIIQNNLKEENHRNSNSLKNI